MREMRVWCRIEATDEMFCERFAIQSRLLGTPADLAESVRRFYQREAPHVEVVRIVELVYFERECH